MNTIRPRDTLQLDRPIKIQTPLLQKFLGQCEHFIDTKTLHEDIRKNLENILNTRSMGFTFSSASTLASSILNYGIVDFSHHYFNNKAALKKLQHHVEAQITHFEPRLKNVEVIIQSERLNIERTLKLFIEAQINLSPQPSPTLFETVFDVTQQSFHLEENSI